MRKTAKIGWLFALLCAALLLGGCAPNPSDKSLYCLPRLPTEYESLKTLIDQLVADGAEYAAPTSGSNLQSVQMVDLDGDGEEEAVAIFRRAGDERPMKIYVFRTVDDSYEQFSVIEGTSNSIYSISYVDLDGDGWREILAGIRSDLDVQNLSVWSVAKGEARQLLLTGYSRYAARDLDGDGRLDLIILHSDEENGVIADYYVWDATEMALCSSLRLPSTIAELNRMTAGTLAGGEAALFVTAVAEDSAVTDILTVSDGALHNVRSGATGEVFRFLDLYPNDVNGDGVTEVPEPVPFVRTGTDETVYYRIRWRQYDAEGQSVVVRETFQDSQSGWSLQLPEGWDKDVLVNRSVSADGSAVTFSRSAREERDSEPFLTVYAFTGYNRTALASRGGRIMLSRQAEVTYAAELYDEGAGMIDEQTLRDSFSLVSAEWTTGEN